MDPFVGEIRIFPGNYAPENWHLCDGSTLPVQGNEALYSLLGTVYGGDGVTNFGLPDLRSRIPVGAEQGPGLSNYTAGQKVGFETVTLQANNGPAHSHAMSATTAPATDTVPNGYFASTAAPTLAYAPQGTNTLVAMNVDCVSYAGGSTPHDNVQPFLVMNYIISLQGTYPSRS